MTAHSRILLTEGQAAEILHLSARTLRGLRTKGMIRYVRPSPRVILYAPEDIEEFIERNKQQDNPTCPSTNQRKAVSGTSISSSRVVAITDLLAKRPGGMPNATKPSSGGRRR